MNCKAANIIIGLLGMMLLMSCQDSPLLSQYEDIDRSAWDSRDTIVFTVPPVEHDCVKDYCVGVRVTGKFKYKNIALRVTQMRDSAVVNEDTVVVPLYDSEGKQLGDGFPYIFKEKYAGKIMLQKNTVNTIRITHLMRMNPLADVASVGVETY